jgi:hypothetical protein
MAFVKPLFRGVKSRGPFDDKRKTLTTRITGSTRNSLENAAKESGRSFSQEIEYRLERSFLFESSLSTIGVEPKTQQFLKEILDCQRLLETELGNSVWKYTDSVEKFKAAICHVLNITGSGLQFSTKYKQQLKNSKIDTNWENEATGRAVVYLALRTKIEDLLSSQEAKLGEWKDFAHRPASTDRNAIKDVVGKLRKLKLADDMGVKKNKKETNHARKKRK